MDDMKLELTIRYYIAEATVWFLGVTLVISRFVGLAPSQPLPLLNVTLENSQHFLRVVAALLAAFTFYLILEWKHSSPEARRSYWVRAHAGITTLFSCTSLWLCYPLIAANTPFAGISPAWYLGFMVIGFLLGPSVSILALASFLIRTPTEARVIQLPRIPAPTRAQYKTWIPVVSFLLVVYYVLCYTAPDVIKGLGFFFVAVPFLFIICVDFASLYLSQDEDGRRIPFQKRFATFKESFDVLEYDHFLNDHGTKILKELDISIKASPEVIQRTMQERFAVESSDRFGFHVQQQEEFQIEFYVKDGNQDNKLLENQGVRIHKRQGKKCLLRVLVIPAEPEKEESREMEIPTSLVETYAEQYLSTHSEDADLTYRKIFSYAINQTVIKTMLEQVGPLLQRAVEAGQEDRVEELLRQDIDVNERAEAGWTALLYAAAQGYPRIARLLLDAGANPDMGNVLGITPLIYGARYGNLEVCSILLEYGANTDVQDVDGRTALMVATRQGQVDVAQMLLKAGGNVAIKDHYDMTALDIAQKYKQGEIAKLIRTANKSIQTKK
jgi:hypothetical protein